MNVNYCKVREAELETPLLVLHCSGHKSALECQLWSKTVLYQGCLVERTSR